MAHKVVSTQYSDVQQSLVRQPEFRSQLGMRHNRNSAHRSAARKAVDERLNADHAASGKNGKIVVIRQHVAVVVMRVFRNLSIHQGETKKQPIRIGTKLADSGFIVLEKRQHSRSNGK